MIKLRFDPKAFGKEFVTRRVRRWMRELFNGVGTQNIAFMVTHDKLMLDYIPPEQLAEYKAKFQPYSGMAETYTDDDVLSWMPDEWANFIKRLPGGEAWGKKQVAQIRTFLLS